MQAIPQSDLFQCLGGPLPAFAARHGRVLQAGHRVLQGGYGGDQMELMEHEADARGPQDAALPLTHRIHIPAVVSHYSRGRHVQRAQ